MEQNTTESGNNAEVVQIIMQEDGQVIMPEQQFIQLNTNEDMQFIQVVSDTGEKQLLQIGDNGEAHMIQLVGSSEQPELVQVSDSISSRSQVVNLPDTVSNIQFQQIAPRPPEILELTDPGEQSELMEMPVCAEDESLVPPVDSRDDDMQISISQPTLSSIYQTIDMQKTSEQAIIPTSIHVLDGTGSLSRTKTVSLMSSQASSSSKNALITSVPETKNTHSASHMPKKPVVREMKSSRIIGGGQLPKSIMISPAADVGNVVQQISEREDNDLTITVKDANSVCMTQDKEASSPELTVPENENTIEPQNEKPIELTSETVISIGGKKCVLRVDSETGQLKAYPFKAQPTPGKRPRGRPRKVVKKESEAITEELKKKGQDMDDECAPINRLLSETENTAAEGLLGLSDADGRRKSSRVKKKPITLTEYETGKIDGVDGEEAGTSQVPIPHFVISNFGENVTDKKETSPKFDLTKNRVQNFLANLGLPVKRGRGRPRRRPQSSISGGPIPAFIIPSSGGQAVMMAPVKGMDTKQPTIKPAPVPVLTAIQPQPPPVADATNNLTTVVISQQDEEVVAPDILNSNDAVTDLQCPTSIIIQQEDGTEVQLLQQADGTITTHDGDTNINLSDLGLIEEHVQAIQNEMDEQGNEVHEVCQDESVIASETDAATSLLQQDNQDGGIIFESMDTEIDNVSIKEDNNDDDEGEMCETHDIPGIDVNSSSHTFHIESGQMDDIMNGSSVSGPTSIIVTTGPSTAEGSIIDGDGESKDSSIPPPTAIIQLPQHLVPLLMPRKDPIKIGLKATETELMKLKCPKCDFQAYYEKQFQAHLASHEGETEKCRCCNFAAFTTEALLDHFRGAHPKNICTECDFTADHPYMVKRHMMRHNPKGCKCDICGKTYKDQYILKMHIKLVHMPAEVLFECNVCSKKFTRKAHLKRHLRIHEPEKPYKCPHCEYRGCERSDISKHLLIHEEPRHECEVCGKAFRHIKNKELHVKRHIGQKDYKCGVCDFYGYTYTDIRKHIERIHSDAKNIMCDKCGCVFKSEAQIKAHHLKQCELMLMTAADLDDVSNPDNKDHITLPSGITLGPHSQVLIDAGVNITVEQVTLPDDEVVSVDLTGAHITGTDLSDHHIVQHAIVDDHLHHQSPDDHLLLQHQPQLEGATVELAVGDQSVVEGVEVIHMEDHGLGDEVGEEELVGEVGEELVGEVEEEELVGEIAEDMVGQDEELVGEVEEEEMVGEVEEEDEDVHAVHSQALHEENMVIAE